MRFFILLVALTLTTQSDAGEILGIDAPQPMRVGDPGQDLVVRTDATFISSVQLELRFGCEESGACETDWLRFPVTPADGVLIWTGGLICPREGDVPILLILTAKRPIETHERRFALSCSP